jgi:peptide/nickel transport system substrate-binding protein
MKPIRRKSTIAIAIAAALVFGVPIGAQAQDGDATPVHGGTLTVLEVLEPDTLDPLFGDQVTNDRTVYNQFYETLIRMMPDGSLEPLLAESFDTDEAAGTITFHLRSGITFHDGEPFDADAVVANLKRLVDPAIDSPKSGEFEQVKSIEATDPSTVVITLNEYAPAVLSSLAHDPGPWCRRRHSPSRAPTTARPMPSAPVRSRSCAGSAGSSSNRHATRTTGATRPANSCLISTASRRSS